MGDRAMLSGPWRAAPVIAGVEATLTDVQAHRSHTAHYGNAPHSELGRSLSAFGLSPQQPRMPHRIRIAAQVSETVES
jgi:hypothetical protein